MKRYVLSTAFTVRSIVLLVVVLGCSLFAQAGTTTYTYDALGRLITATYNDTGAIVTYAYDAAGNRTQVSTSHDTMPPSVPTGLTGAAHSQTRIDLDWTASTDNVGVTGYRIYRAGIQIGTSTFHAYSDLTVVGSTSYTYTVAARDAAGNVSAPSAPRTVATPDVTAPSIPTGLSAAPASPSRINLSWSASSDTGGSGLAGYTVYRGGSPIASTASTSYSDIGLASSTTYSYTVAAYDNMGNTSSQSNTASATTLPAVAATVSSGSWRWVRNGTRPVKVDPPVVCSASGGSGAGYTFVWQYISGDTQTSVNSPNSSSTIWSRSVPNQNVTYTSMWRCLATDSAGNTGQTAVQVTFIRNTIQ
jgi:chitodextrinase